MSKAATFPLLLATAPFVLLVLGFCLALLGARQEAAPRTAATPQPRASAPAPERVTAATPKPVAPAAPQPTSPAPRREAPVPQRPDRPPSPTPLDALPPTAAPPREARAPAPVRKTKTIERPAPLVVVRAGSAMANTEVFASGDAVPQTTAMRVGPTALHLEGSDAANIYLSPRSRFELRGTTPRLELHLERGALFARSQTGSRLAYAVSTPDGVARPVGTEFLINVGPASQTRVMTFAGAVRVGPSPSEALVTVRRGFQADLQRGRHPLLPEPARPSRRTFRWLPPGSGPTLLPSPPRLLRTLTFDDGERFGFSKGTVRRGGAMRSRYCLVGEAYKKGDGRSVVRWEGKGLFPLEPGTWIEAMVRVERDTKLTFRLWDAKRAKSVKREVALRGGEWTPLAVALETLKTSSGGRTALDLAGPCARLEITSGDCKGKRRCELLVDNLRVYRE